MKTAQFIRRNPERVDNTYPTPTLLCLLWTPFLPTPTFRGEMSQDLLLAWLLVSYPGVLAARVPRRTRRATERQSRLIFVALQEGSWGRLVADCAFHTPGEGWEQEIRRGVRKGKIWGQSRTVCNLLTEPDFLFPLLEPYAQ